MNDYICPECGHEARQHRNLLHMDKCNCLKTEVEVYQSIIATKDQALAEAREAIASLNGLARGLEDDDPYFFEQRNGNEIVEHASQWLQKSMVGVYSKE